MIIVRFDPYILCVRDDARLCRTILRKTLPEHRPYTLLQVSWNAGFVEVIIARLAP